MNQYNKYFTLEHLIKYGYFEIKSRSNNLNQEDPYSQSTVIFQEVFDMEILSECSREIISLLSLENGKLKNCPTVPIEISIYKNDEERRIYKMPNIYSYIRLAAHLEENRNTYLEIIMNSPQSLSKYFYEKTFTSNKIEKESNRMGFRYIFKTDIQHFYPSIYTHSIPWILAGKQVAKRTRANKKLYYNNLDSLIQDCQYGETHGIPTGTMATRIIAEIFMCKLDEFLSRYSYKRYVDDFEFPYNSTGEQIEFYNSLQKVLGEYNLVIKREKNLIEAYPFETDTGSDYFFSYFNQIAHDDNTRVVRAKVHRYIEKALCLQKEGLKGAPKLIFKGLEHAVESNKLSSSIINQPILSKLLNIVIMTPSTGAYMIAFFNNESIDISHSSINSNLIRHKELIIRNIERFIKLNYNQELFSLLGILYYYKTRNFLSPEILLDIIKLEDDFSSVLAMEIFLENYMGGMNQLLECVEGKLEHTKSWEEEYWFFKYHFFLKVEVDKRFKKSVKDYIFQKYNSNNLNRSEFFNQKNIKKIDSFLLRIKQSQSSDATINKFFELLIERKISFLK